MRNDDDAYTDDGTEKPIPDESSKPGPKNRRERRNRKPQRSSRIETTNWKDIDNPEEQYSIPGEAPEVTRYDQVRAAGALDGYLGTNVFRKEISKLQDEQNAFVAWQAKQDDYIIYQNVEFDEEKGMDKWEPVSYSYYPLTVGQRLALQKLEAELADLNRSAANNDREVDHVNDRVYEKQVELMKEQCARYMRMDVENEFEISSYADVTLAIASARYAEAHVPKSQRMRMPSSNTSSAKKSAGIS